MMDLFKVAPGATTHAHVLEISPDMATAWLEANKHNRTIRKATVIHYARDMANGDWLFNGDPIRFAADGTLIDGQHRLLAIVQSGVTIQSVVVLGLPEVTQDTIDIGARRTFRDQLFLHGEAHSKHLASIARRVVQMQRTGSAVSVGGIDAPTYAEMAAYIASNPTIHRAAEVASRVQRHVPIAPSVIGAAYHVCSAIDESDAEYFYVTQVIEGIGLWERDPARVLTRKYQLEAQGGRMMVPDDAYRYAIVAWNHYRAGHQISKLQMPKGGWAGKNPIPK